MHTFEFIYKISTGEWDPNYSHLIDAPNEAEAIKIWKAEGPLLKSNMTINFFCIK